MSEMWVWIIAIAVGVYVTGAVWLGREIKDAPVYDEYPRE